ncbi:hypothetical protein [Deinococcus planocerae]|uniref:hypothetical protein n=1 Tax=Deinococcus planocerae TaxID=1737569 RepID=UPI000C7F011C|nr:hypothetical protein [Deinococcus planocerae]
MTPRTGEPKGRRPLALAALALGAGGTTTAQTTTPPTVTGVQLYTPFQPGGGLLIGVGVTGQVSGTCFAASAASPTRPDAYRCSAGNRILDPCFASLNERDPLACSPDPWGANAVLLTRSGALPGRTRASEPNYLSGTPWALELANGQRCVALTGATAPIAGLRVNYGCPDGGVVAGPIDRTLPLWRGFYETANRSLSLSQVGVRTAWF